MANWSLNRSLDFPAMNSRAFIIIVCVGGCLATLIGTVVQGRKISDLRAEREQLASDDHGAPTQLLADGPKTQARKPVAADSPSLERLQLRSEVNRLMSRRRELLTVTNENARLRSQVAVSRTNAATAVALPPGYVRKSEARFVGYSTPENTVQSLLWAVQNQDFTNMMTAFTPDVAGQMRKQLERTGGDEFFKNAGVIPGMHIVSQATALDGSIEAEVEIIPGQPLPDKMRFRQINGEWKLETH